MMTRPLAPGDSSVSALEALVVFLSTASTDELEAEADRRSSQPVALRTLYKGLAALYRGHAEQAEALMRRSYTSAREPYRSLSGDVLLGLLTTRYKFVEARALRLRLAQSPAALQPGIVALAASHAAYGGDRKLARALLRKATTMLRRLDTPALRMRALSRLAVAAFATDDLDDAESFARGTTLLATELGALRILTYALSVLVAIARYHSTDEKLSVQYADRIIETAQKAEDTGALRYGLVVRGSVAFEFGKREDFRRIHKILATEPAPEQQAEGLGAIMLDVAALAYDKRYREALLLLLRANERIQRCRPAQQALLAAVKAMCLLGNGDADDARIVAREAMSLSKPASEQDTIMDRHDRTLARLLSAGVAYYLGDVVRARRALSRSFDPQGRVFASFRPNRLSVNAVPSWFLGYAQTLNIAVQEARSSQYPGSLTAREYDVLVALLTGGSRRRVAEALNKSPSTIARQAESIYRKLGVHSRAELIIRAAELDLRSAARVK